MAKYLFGATLTVFVSIFSSYGRSKVYAYEIGGGDDDEMPAAKLVKDLISKHPLMVFSKTMCPYCRKVKEIFKTLQAEAEYLELNRREDGSEIQDALQEMYGTRTVPKVFVASKFLGGGTDIVRLYDRGELMKILIDGNVKVGDCPSSKSAEP